MLPLEGFITPVDRLKTDRREEEIDDRQNMD
jgi:hypothetical protein